MAEPAAAADPSRIAVDDVSDHTLVTLELGYGLLRLVDDTRGAPLVARLTGVRKQLSQTFGFVVPPFRVRDSLELPPEDYRILLGGAPVGRGSLRIDRLLAIDTGEVGNAVIPRGESTRDPSFGCPAVWIDPAVRDHAVADGWLAVDPATVVATQLSQLLGERPAALLGPDEVRDLLDRLKEHAAALVETVHPQPLSLAQLTRLLRALLEDGIPIGHPLPILASLAQAVQQTLEHDRLIDLVRADLGPLIVGRICPPTERLPVITLDAALEATIVQGLSDPLTGQPAIEPDLAARIGQQIAQLCAEPQTATPALIVQPRARRALAALLRLRAPACTVLSIAELPVAQPIEVIAVVGGAQRAAPERLAA